MIVNQGPTRGDARGGTLDAPLGSALTTLSHPRYPL